jgi:pimeloyl-ACP methyl ester carboxylesterase
MSAISLVTLGRFTTARQGLPPLRLLPVDPEYVEWEGQHIATYQAGSGEPVLLVHSIHAAASVFEMRRPFLSLQHAYAVHTMDLLGYGCSDRPARQYSAEDFIAQIEMMLNRIGKPTAVIASSLGAAFAVTAANRRPDLVSKLILICPVGVRQLANPPGPAAWATYRLLRSPFGENVYRGLTSAAGVRYFLMQQAYARSETIDDETMAGFLETTRRPGAYYAPICFVSGLLNRNISAGFANLRCPVLLVWGRESRTTPPREADPFLELNPAARLAIIDSAGGLAQDERPEEFMALARDFLRTG